MQYSIYPYCCIPSIRGYYDAIRQFCQWFQIIWPSMGFKVIIASPQEQPSSVYIHVLPWLILDFPSALLHQYYVS